MAVQGYHRAVPNLAGFQGGTQTICTSPEYVARVHGHPPGMEDPENNPCRALVRFNVHDHQRAFTTNDLLTGNPGPGLTFEAVAIIINSTQIQKLVINEERISVSFKLNEIKFVSVSREHKVDTFAEIIKWGSEFNLRFPEFPIDGDQAPTLSVLRR